MNISQKIRKIIGIVCIATVSISAVIGICYLLNLFGSIEDENFHTIMGKIVLTMLTFFGVSIFMLNSTEAINRKNIFGYISGILLLLSGALFLIAIWAPFNQYYLDAVVLISSISVLFSVAVSLIIVLGYKLLPIQIILYITLSLGLLVLNYLIFTGKGIFGESTLTIAVIDVIVAIVMFVVLRVKSKLNTKNDSDDMITISKKEYQNLKNRIKELESKLHK